jgi:Phosphotransferase enzyme family
VSRTSTTLAVRPDTQPVGPLKGHHNVSYAVELDPDSELGRRFRWLKLREARSEVFWYDLRCFASDGELLAGLWGRVPRIPQVVRIDDLPSTQSYTEYIEGRTLGELEGRQGPIRDHHLDQLGEVFGALAAIDVADLPLERAAGHLPHGHAGPDDDSTGFLARLLAHTVEVVYGPHRTALEGLFDRLGVPDRALRRFAARRPTLTPRPYRLLHADLWTIDWELARIGDPVYDLATHLHLMRYPARQEARITRIWQEAVGAACPAAVVGAVADLAPYLAYKRVQSVYTDVIRAAAALGDAADGTEPARVLEVARGVRDALARARGVLGLDSVPSVEAVRRTLTDWARGASG